MPGGGRYCRPEPLQPSNYERSMPPSHLRTASAFATVRLEAGRICRSRIELRVVARPRCDQHRDSRRDGTGAMSPLTSIQRRPRYLRKQFARAGDARAPPQSAGVIATHQHATVRSRRGPCRRCTTHRRYGRGRRLRGRSARRAVDATSRRPQYGGARGARACRLRVTRLRVGAASRGSLVFVQGASGAAARMRDVMDDAHAPCCA